MSREVSYRLSLDAKGFSASAKEAEKQFDSLVKGVASGSGQLGQIAAAAGPLGLSLAAIGGAAVVAGKTLFDFAKGAMELGARLQDMHARTGLSAESLQKLGAAAVMTGGSMETAAGAANILQKNLAKSPEHFRALGLSVEELRHANPEDLLLSVSDKLQQLPEGTQRAMAGFSLLGKGAAEYLPLLSSNIREVMERTDALGNVLSGSSTAGLKALDDETKMAGLTWDGFKNQLGATIATSPGVIEAVTGIVKALSELTKWVRENKETIQTIAGLISGRTLALDRVEQDEQLRAWNRQALAGGMGSKNRRQRLTEDQVIAGMGAAMHPGFGAGPIFDPEAKKNADEMAKKAEEVRAAWQRGAEKARSEWDKFYEGLGTGSKNAFQSMQGDIDKYVAKVIKDQTHAGERWIDDLAKGRDAEHSEMEYAADVDQKLAEARQKHIEEEISGLRDLAAVVASLGGTWGTVGAGILNVLANLKDKSLQAASATQKIAGAASAAIAAYKGGSVLGGAASGAAAGAAFGPWGAVIGGIGGGILGLFGHKSQQAKELKDLNAELTGLQAQAAKAGVALHLAFNPKDAKSLKAAIDEVHKALDLRAQAQQKLDEAIQRYGFTEEQLGPKLAGQKLDEQMGQIYQDWQLLTAAGVDHGAMLEKIGPKVGELTDKYLQAGVEIPKSMKPIIDDLYEHHRLLHANGEEYTQAEYDGLKYGESMSDMFKDLLQAVKDLVDALNGIPPKKTTDVTVNTHYNGALNDDGSPDRDGDPATPMARGGLVRARRGGTVVRLGEGGEDEYVVPKSKAGAFATSMGGHTVSIGDVHVHGGNSAEVLASLQAAIERGAARGILTAMRRQGVVMA